MFSLVTALISPEVMIELAGFHRYKFIIYKLYTYYIFIKKHYNYDVNH